MEDEVDVDIEGVEFDARLCEPQGGALVHDQFSQSAWKSSSGILPWELDASISAENREVIESMLLEEQYYLTGKDYPDIWHRDVDSKPKGKKSPTKTSSSVSSFRWSKQEKELFEQGLAQFGRRWTKIAKLVGSRTILQVKSYARQYFKHKAKSELGPAAPSTGPAVPLQSHQPGSSHAATLVNTVRIEKHSEYEDEDVDITDDLSIDNGGESRAVPEYEFCKVGLVKGMDIQTDGPVHELVKKEAGQRGVVNTGEVDTMDSPSAPSPQSPQLSSSLSCSEEPGRTRIEENGNKTVSLLPDNLQVVGNPDKNGLINNNHRLTEQSYRSDSWKKNGPVENPCRESRDCSDTGDQRLSHNSNDDQEEEQGEEDEDLKAPEQEIDIDRETITEDEKQAIPEFFEGRSSKTPERYLKIRNYIVDQWVKIKPKYLNKTSVRPGLKNCGDVNCIGRIHTYLELIGAINFNCEQAVYKRPKIVEHSKHKEGKDALEAYQLAQRLQSMRTRKRRVRDIWGNWCDAKDLEGQTYEHLSAEELALRREEMKKNSKTSKICRHRGSFDPFQLIPCRSFGEDVQEPFQLIVCAETLLIMDMHAHVSRGEVIGLLGGIFSEEDKVLKICAAEPCNSVSTGLQCEMDPVSQTQACDILSALGFSVVGWYHSHPSFHPSPSVRDIHTQDQFQNYFSRGGAPFIGMIVSPYDPANPSPHSQTTCLLVRESLEPSGPESTSTPHTHIHTPQEHKLPYRFDFVSSQDIPDWDQTLRRAQWIINKYSQTPGSVQMSRFFRRDSHLTCLEKMLSSLARYFEPLPDEEGDSFLTQIQTLFQSDFIAKQQISDQEEGEALNASSTPLDSHELPTAQLNNQERLQVGESDWGPGGTPECNLQPGVHATNLDMTSSAVLHLGSVLLTGHDYLL